jgi:nicotinamidase-related amidase
MAITIDKEHSALLAMDFANDVVHVDGAFKDAGFAEMVKQNDVFGKLTGLLDAARGAGVKVIYASVKFRPGYPELNRSAGLNQEIIELNSLVEGTWGANIHEAVAPQEGDLVITKRSVSAFAGSDLANLLSASGITTLLLSGVSTNFVVEGTARDAVDRGYNVVVVEDCCASGSQEAHHTALTTALPALATIANSAEVIAALAS